MIKLVRLDYRLLHGQVVFSWTGHVGAQRIIVVDDDAANDEMKKSALLLSKPAGVRVNIFTVDKAIAKMPKVEQLDEKIMMIFGNLLAAQGAALVESFMNGALSLLAGWFGPDTVLHMATGGAAPAPSISDGSAAIAIIGGADGPTAIFTTIKLAPHLLGPIAIAAYSYMALVPVIIPLVVKLTCTKKELMINMKEQEKLHPSTTEIKNLRVLKIIFPIAVTTVVALFVPTAVPLIGMLMFGNLLKEIGADTSRLFDAASNSIMNAATIFLGLCVGGTMTVDAFLNMQTIGIVIGGFLAFALSIASGIAMVKIFNLFSKKKINPLIGATGLSAVPMASRVCNEIATKYDVKNHVLNYCMASNISGVIGSAVAAGVLISFLG